MRKYDVENEISLLEYRISKILYKNIGNSDPLEYLINQLEFFIYQIDTSAYLPGTNIDILNKCLLRHLLHLILNF